VAVLVGGLESWTEAGHPLEPLRDANAVPGIAWKELPLEQLFRAAAPPPMAAESAFLPRIAGQTFLEGRELPLKREMVALFVDMVGSTRLVLSRSTEEVLDILQAFMEIVIDVGAYHCGDVHDFEGDGALLYFEGPGEALPAAFRLRDELLARRAELPALPLPRLSLDTGPIVIGIVGTRFRRTVSLVGPAVHIAARILKLAPAGGIVATEAILESARRTNSELTRQFVPLEGAASLLDEDLGTIRAWVAPPPADLAGPVSGGSAHRARPAPPR
jgi:class 3 adenylate cyclase